MYDCHRMGRDLQYPIIEEKSTVLIDSSACIQNMQANPGQSKCRPRKSIGVSAVRASLDVMKIINHAGDVNSTSIPEGPC